MSQPDVMREVSELWAEAKKAAEQSAKPTSNAEADALSQQMKSLEL